MSRRSSEGLRTPASPADVEPRAATATSASAARTPSVVSRVERDEATARLDAPAAGTLADWVHGETAPAGAAAAAERRRDRQRHARQLLRRRAPSGAGGGGAGSARDGGR